MAGSDDLMRGLHELSAARDQYDDAWSFWRGTRDEEFSSAAIRRVLRLTAGRYQVNLAKVPIKTLSHRLKITSMVALGADGTRDEDADAALQERVVKANRMNLQWKRLFRNTLIMGDGHLYIWQGDTEGTCQVSYNSPLIARCIYDDESEIHPAYGIKRWTRPDGKLEAQLLYPDRTEPGWVLTGGGNSGESSGWKRTPGVEDIPNRWGILPLFHFRTDMPYGVPAHEDAWGAQDAINKMSTTMAHTIEASGFKQRYALTDPAASLTGDAGDATDWDDDAEADVASRDDSTLRGGPGEINILAGIKSVGEWSPATPESFIEPADWWTRMTAMVTDTPMHYIDQRGQAPSGEALALDTRVPSPDGWTTMGSLRVGDRVFDEAGTIQRVTQAYAVMEGRPCYRVTFDDGTEIVADAGHKWMTRHSYGKGGKLRQAVQTTEEIAAGLRRRHAIRTALPLDTPEADLPLDPYVLGVWLGDGCKHHFTVIQHVDDAYELAEHIAATGQFVRVREIAKRPTCRMLVMDPANESGMCRRGHVKEDGRCKPCTAATNRKHRHGEEFPYQSFKEMMRAQGFYLNKHIPETYFNASHKQRLALLQGLMDTDGTVYKANGQGSVSIALSDERLAHDLHRLVQGLGHKVRMTSRESKHYGRVVGTEWRMAWSAPDPVFRMERKLRYQRTEWGPLVREGGAHPYLRYIKSVEPVDSVPVRCIEVSGPSHLFLVTDALVATHNSLRVATAPLLESVGNIQEYLDATAADAMAFALAVLGFEGRRVDVRWKSPGVVDDQLTWTIVAQKIAAGVPPKVAIAETGLYEPAEIEAWLAESSIEMDVSRRITLLAQVAAAVQGLGQGVALGMIDDGQARAVVDATIGQLTPELEPPDGGGS